MLEKTDYLNFLKEADDDNDIDSIDIFTLNHDLVIESFLKSQTLNYVDGFDKDDTEKSMKKENSWEPETFESDECKIKLYKLHGSIDWRIYEQDWKKYLCKVPLSWSPETGFSLYPPLLIGTTNKILNYSTQFYLDIFYNFYKSLQESEILILSGYGFNDKGINSQITNWKTKTGKEEIRKIIVIDENTDNIYKLSKEGISKKYIDSMKNNLTSEQTLFQEQKKIECITWTKIKEYLTK